MWIWEKVLGNKLPFFFSSNWTINWLAVALAMHLVAWPAEANRRMSPNFHFTGSQPAPDSRIPVAPPTDRNACGDQGGTTRPLSGYNPNIDQFPSLESVKKGQLVEFNPPSVKNMDSYLKGVSERGGIPEWYWVGANCNMGPDCDRLSGAGVKLGSTGTPEWDKTEKRLMDLEHPAVLQRTKDEMEKALRAAATAGSDLVFRIDNLHDLDDDRFYKTKDKRDFAKIGKVVGVWDELVKKMRADGTLKPEKIYGLTAHNNFKFWDWHVNQGGTPPVLLRMENPTQFGPGLDEGFKLAQKLQVPFIGVEFSQGHGYKLDSQKLEEVKKKVSNLIVMPNENNYTGGQEHAGGLPATGIRAPTTGNSCLVAQPRNFGRI